MILSYTNMQTPRKLLLGPWGHCGTKGDAPLDLQAEYHRWYDRWLKGVHNGIMDEPPITYYTMGAPEGRRWRAADQWPLPDEQPTSYYFAAGPSGSIASVNDGSLGLGSPTSVGDSETYAVDTTCTSRCGTYQMTRRDLRESDAKGLTYTTAPLDADLEVTGHPVLHLWVSSTARDGDFFVFLEEVDPDGYSRYVSKGTLRASHRAVHPPPYDNLGLPWHRSLSQDATGLVPGEPTELTIPLQPTSNVFNVGQRIRVTITCAEREVVTPLDLPDGTTVTVYRNASHASHVTLPVIP